MRWLRSLLTLLALMLLAASPARAALDRATIEQAGFHALRNTQLPLDAVVTERGVQTTLGYVLGGKPALLVFVDYQCRSLCGIVLDRLTDVLPNVPLRLGREYGVIAVALDERQTQIDAIAFRDQHIRGTSLAALGRYLTEDRPARDAIERSVGLVAPYDAEHERFAHPAGLVALDGTGRIQAVLSPLAIDARDIELALMQGTAPRSLVGHVLQLCYGYNAVTGSYNVRIERILSIAAASTILLMGAGLALLLLHERRSQQSRKSRG